MEEIQIYYNYDGFKSYHLFQFQTYLKRIEEKKLINKAPTLIDHYNYLDGFYVEKINILNSINHSDEIDKIKKILSDNFDTEKINSFSHSLDFEYWDIKIEDLKDKAFYFALRLRGSLNKIDEFIQNKLVEYQLTNENIKITNKKTKYSTHNKIQIKGSLQSIGYLFSELIDKGFIEAPKRNGKDNTSAISRMILEHFEFIDKEEQPKPEDIRKTLFSENKLSADKQKLFKIPECKIINTD